VYSTFDFTKVGYTPNSGVCFYPWLRHSSFASGNFFSAQDLCAVYSLGNRDDHTLQFFLRLRDKILQQIYVYHQQVLSAAYYTSCVLLLIAWLLLCQPLDHNILRTDILGHLTSSNLLVKSRHSIPL